MQAPGGSRGAYFAIVRPLLTFPWTEVLVVSRERGVSSVKDAESDSSLPGPVLMLSRSAHTSPRLCENATTHACLPDPAVVLLNVECRI